LQRSLNAGTSVGVTTTGANAATGDPGVASSLRWSGPASLTLAACHDVSVTTGTTIANTGAANLTLRADASEIDNGGTSSTTALSTGRRIRASSVCSKIWIEYFSAPFEAPEWRTQWVWRGAWLADGAAVSL